MKAAKPSPSLAAFAAFLFGLVAIFNLILLMRGARSPWRIAMVVLWFAVALIWVVVARKFRRQIR